MAARICLPLAILLLAPAAARAQPAPKPANDCAIWSARPAVTVQLLFGRAIAGGGRIDDTAWRVFLAREVTPRFPDGLTILEGRGQWRSRRTGRIGSEASTMVEIVITPSADVAVRLAAIRAAYERAFHQESVGLVVNVACANF